MTLPALDTKKVLLVGWDAADWKVIHPLMDRGQMPNVQRLVEQGSMANLATLHPVLSPMLWTSISTGKRPFKHGIHGFSEPAPDGSHIRPMTTVSRKTKAIWNILTQNNLTSNVVGWWPSNPAEPIRGTMVSNLFQQPVGPPEQPWPVRPGSVHPPELTDTLAELRLNPNELLAEHILPFVPQAKEIDQDEDRRLASVAKILAECTTVHSVATWLMQNQPWDFMAVYYDAIDHFCHGFMKYHPPRQEHVRERDYELYKNVVNAGYIYHDMMLGALLQLAGEDTTVILMSDHGFHPDHLRPKALPMEPAGPAAEHRDLGIFVISGPGIRKDEFIAGPNLLDIAPTLLTLFGLPVGEDMDGRPILDAFEQPPEVETIPSWDDVEGDAGTHPPDLEIDAEHSQEAINQLVALGYIEAPDANKEKAIANTVRELQYNLALSYMDDAQHGAAAEIIEDLYQQWPNEHRFGVRLANSYLALNQTAELRSIVEDLGTRRKQDAEAAREELLEFRQRIKDRLNSESGESDGDAPASPELDRAQTSIEEDDETGPAERLLKPGQKLTEAEQQTLRTLRAHAQYNPHWIQYLWGNVHLAEGSYEQALDSFRRAEQAEPDRPGLHLQLAETHLRMRNLDQAETCYQKALEIDPYNARALLGMARCQLRRRKVRRAAELARESIGLLYSDSYAHFVLGVALHRMKNTEGAVRSLETALSLNPNFPQAHRRLAMIFRRDYHDVQQGKYHARLAAEMRSEIRKRRSQQSQRPYATVEPFVREPLIQPQSEQTSPQSTDPNDVTPGGVVTVVTGLPRAGTSMLMQMLQAGGMQALTDGVRVADEDNPRGYFEYEGAKRLQTDRTWVGEAVDKSVKVVAQLLPYLPRNFQYRVLLVHRDLDEVLKSQRTMLDRQGKDGAQLSDTALKNVFSRQLERVQNWLQRAPHVRLLELDHGAVIQDPVTAASQVQEFLGADLDSKKMAAAVQPSLYRQRTEQLESIDQVTKKYRQQQPSAEGAE